MQRFRKIQNDKTIVELYNKISEFEDLDKGWAHHNLEHVNNVAELVEVLLHRLGYDKEFIEEARIAAILHDTGAVEGKEDHALRSYEFAKQYIESNDIVLKNKDLVLEAIKIHSNGFDSDNIIASTLILADKLDIKCTRVAKEGYNVKGMRQLQYIKDIILDIYDSNLEIRIICDDNINKNELEEFYFMTKVFKAIINFCEKMNLKPKVFINDLQWNFFEEMLNSFN